jgi:hypothetical protein
VLVIAATAIVKELLVLASAMLTVMIVAIIALSVQPLTPLLVGKMLQFAFVLHALRRLMPLQSLLMLWDEYPRDTHNTLTMPLLCSSAKLPCGFEAECHGLPCCV